MCPPWLDGPCHVRWSGLICFRALFVVFVFFMPDWDVGRKSCQRPRIDIGFYPDPRKTTFRHWTGLFPNTGVYVLSPDSGELTGFCRFPWSWLQTSGIWYRLEAHSYWLRSILNILPWTDAGATPMDLTLFVRITSGIAKYRKFDAK